MNNAISDFLLSGRQAGWSAGAVRSYGWHLARFAAWCAAREVLAPAGLTRSLVRAWGASIRDGWAPSTVKGATTAVRSFLRWLHGEGLAVDLVGVLRAPRVPERVQRTITVDEVAKLLVACVPAAHGLGLAAAVAVAARNAALVALLYDSLLRASEVCALQVSDLDLATGRLTVRRGKGGRGRLALYGQQTGLLLQAWLALRPAGSPWVFVSLGGSTPGEPLTPRGLRIILKALGERAGIQGVSPHAFRRGGTCQLLLSDVPSRVVQMLGGWSRLAMVEVYSRWLQVDDLGGVYCDRSPVAAAVSRNHAEGVVNRAG